MPVFGPEYRYLRLTSSRKRLMRLNPRDFTPDTKLSFEKYASATMSLHIDSSCLQLRLSILRYHPVRESGSFIPLVQSGFRPRFLSVKVCSAFRKTESLASASTMDMPNISSPFFIAAAQPDQNQSMPGVFLPDLEI